MDASPAEKRDGWQGGIILKHCCSLLVLATNCISKTVCKITQPVITGRYKDCYRSLSCSLNHPWVLCLACPPQNGISKHL